MTQGRKAGVTAGSGATPGGGATAGSGATPGSGATAGSKRALWLRSQLGGTRGIVLRFLVLYPAIVILLAGLLSTEFVGTTIDGPINTLTATIAARGMSLIGLSASSSGIEIIYDQRTVAVKTGCSGLELLAVLLPAILVFPSSLRAKLLGALAAVAFVLPLNAIRVASLSVLLSKSSDAFNLFHLYFWQAALVGCLFGFFLVWMRGATTWTTPGRS